jgi:hypothetical protein
MFYFIVIGPIPFFYKNNFETNSVNYLLFYPQKISGLEIYPTFFFFFSFLSSFSCLCSVSFFLVQQPGTAHNTQAAARST